MPHFVMVTAHHSEQQAADDSSASFFSKYDLLLTQGECVFSEEPSHMILAKPPYTEDSYPEIRTGQESGCGALIAHNDILL